MPKVPDGAGALCPYVLLLVGLDFNFEGLLWSPRRPVQEGALGQLDLEWMRHPDISWGRWGAPRSLRLGGREPVRPPGPRGRAGAQVLPDAPLPVPGGHEGEPLRGERRVMGQALS